MRKLWVATMAAVAAVSVSPVRAADLPRKAPDETPPPSSWGGCYLGIVGGGLSGSSQHISANAATSGVAITPKFNEGGGTAGGTVGCNYDLHGWILGVENDMSWANGRGSSPDQPPFNLAAVSHTDQKWLDSVRGRIGLVWERSWMTYVTGGAAFVGTSVNICNPGLALCANQSQVRTGWIGGVGLEYAIWTNLSVKFEYLHADFGSGRYFTTPTSLGVGTIVTRDVELKDDLFRAGLNWRFTPFTSLP
jgi:outer membrane immunogenic protein